MGSAVGTYVADSATSQERDASAVLDSIGAEQMSQMGDSSAASALKRVAGVSVVGGQFAVVRGLQGRYISSTLNGGLMPSTDPMRRDVPLDLFPAAVLVECFTGRIYLGTVSELITAYPTQSYIQEVVVRSN